MRRIASSPRTWVSRVQPATETIPPRTSTPTRMREVNADSASSSRSGSVNAAVPSTTRLAPAASARRIDAIERSPPPSSTGTSSSEVMRSTCSRFAGSPSRAPSRSTTWRKRAPASTKERAASSGSSA